MLIAMWKCVKCCVEIRSVFHMLGFEVAKRWGGKCTPSKFSATLANQTSSWRARCKFCVEFVSQITNKPLFGGTRNSQT